jgi:PHD/YefM family antitoxin component YafN of YafNO toxin-antitoxin module
MTYRSIQSIMLQIRTISAREMFRHYKRVVATVKQTGQPTLVVSQKHPQIALVSLSDLQELQAAKQRQSTKALLGLAGSIPKGSGLPNDLAENHSVYAWD